MTFPLPVHFNLYIVKLRGVVPLEHSNHTHNILQLVVTSLPLLCVRLLSLLTAQMFTVYMSII